MAPTSYRHGAYRVRRTAYGVEHVGLRPPTRYAVRCTQNAQHGLTLPEFLIVAAIALIIGAVLLTIALTGGQLWRSGEAAVQAQEEARRAITNMTRELREAEAGSPAATNGNTQLDFMVILGFNVGGDCPAAGPCAGARDAAGVPHGDWTVRYTFDAANGQLERQVFDDGGNPQGALQVLANRVTGVTFTPIGTDEVTVSLTTAARETGTAGPQHQHRADTRVRLRNAP